MDLKKPSGEFYKNLFETLIREDWVYVVVDCSNQKVRVPKHLKDDYIRLQIGYNMPNPIKDLKIDEKGFSCTLSFRTEPFFCEIPWEACSQFNLSTLQIPIIIFELPKNKVRIFKNCLLRINTLAGPIDYQPVTDSRFSRFDNL